MDNSVASAVLIKAMELQSPIEMAIVNVNLSGVAIAKLETSMVVYVVGN